MIGPPVSEESVDRHAQISGTAAVMRPWIPASQDELIAERPAGWDEDVHFTRALAEAVLTDLTGPGSRVLDPFVGYGTSLVAAARCGADAVGVELLPERAEVARRAAPGAQVVTGDARDLRTCVEGRFDLVLTSPPYRTRTEHPADPLTGYQDEGGDYAVYLDDLTAVFEVCLDLLNPGGHLVVNVANILAEQGFTPLAWDVGLRLDALGAVVQEVPVCWDRPPHDLTGDCLIVVRRR